MQRDVKVGIAIGVLLIALIGVFWWARHNKTPATPPETVEPVLPTPIEPVGPGMTAPPIGPVAPGPVAPATTVPGPGEVGPIGPASTVPEPPAAVKRTYKVQSGDSLATIAKRFYGDEGKWQLIWNANKEEVPNANRLSVGTDLVIPEAGETPTPATTTGSGAPSSGPTKHVVAKGETLRSIARKVYGSDSKANVDRIYQANKAKIGSDPDDIKVGMELTVPAAR